MIRTDIMLVAALSVVLVPQAAISQQQEVARPVPTAEGIAFFEAKVRPVLAKHCYRCHSRQTGKSESGLVLDSRDDLRRGGDRGAAIVPGKPEKSLLLQAVSHSDPDLEMPPGKPRLPDRVIADLRKWIEIGAPDPRTGGATASVFSEQSLEERRKFWAFQTPDDHELPQTSDPEWARRNLDHFLLAMLDKAALSPSPDATSEVLLRRVCFALVGLPPSVEQRSVFLGRVAAEGIESALGTEVDALLASERFGERWGRHWLDVARYAESSGKETNVSLPYAWRYRDYVIESFNADKPFDRFLTEQLAGDLLPYDDDRQRVELMIATGFLAVGPKGLNEMNRLQFVADVIDEQIDTVTRAVLASSVACARCHDHKFDPYSMHDYYALAGIFASTQTHYGTSVAPGNQVGGDLVTLPSLEGQVVLHQSLQPAQYQKLKGDLTALNKEETDRRAAAKKAFEEGKDPGEFFSLRDALRILWGRGRIEGRLKMFDDEGRALPLAMGTLDRDQPIDAPVLERGEINRPGELVPRGFPTVFNITDSISINAGSSGRLELARWLTHPEHPLTARVMANRVWRHLFGAGLVATVDNFGQNGARPSHPELLDHLAIHLVRNGWSIKSLIREIVLSRAFRQSSDYRADAFQQDPENRLLWRMSKRRLDAEAIRDAMLVASENLDTKRPVGSLIGTIGDRPIAIIAFDKRVPPDLDGSKHRSVYLPILRDRLPEVLDLFDFAEPSLVTGDRQTTNVPLQALYLMNSPFVMTQAKSLAETVTKPGKSPEERLRLAFVRCFGREPDETELQLAVDFIATQGGARDASEDDILRTLGRYCQSLLATAEFRNLD